MRKRANRRRGALLLVVLSLLVLFLIVAVTFVVVGRNFHGAADSNKRAELTGDDPQKSLDKAFQWIMSGPGMDELRNAQNQAQREAALAARPVAVESLLEDEYGWHWVRGNWTNATKDMGGQLLTVSVSADQHPKYSFNSTKGYYNGGVLTVLTGEGRGLSSRIVNYQPVGTNGASGTFAIEALKTDGNDSIEGNLGDDRKVLINARPFGGYRVPTDNPLIPATSDWHDREINEEYDGFDDKNPLLAELVPSSGSRDVMQTDRMSLESLVRILKDAPTVVPEVDNDADAEPDSGWVDPGFGIKCLQSPQSGIPKAQRIYYREWIAVLCRDLDSRVNLNAHGNLEQLEDNYYAGGKRQGMGYGPADINPFFLYYEATPTNAEALYENLFFGNGTYPYDGNGEYAGRYGDDSRPGIKDTDEFFSAIKNVGLPSKSFTDSVSGYGSPPDLWGAGQAPVNTNDFDDFGHPKWNDFMLGKPQATAASVDYNSQAIDDPYEFDPYLGGPAPTITGITATQAQTYYDRPLTPAELETVLRYYDADRPLLPQRILQMCGKMLDDGDSGSSVDDDVKLNRHRITTLSSHVPVIDAPVMDVQWQDSHPNFVTAYKDSSDYPESLLPYEVMRGLKMDLNRLFGNGEDDTKDGEDGAGVTDESEVYDSAGVIQANEENESTNAWPSQTASGDNLPTDFQSASFSHSEITATNYSIHSRQLYARHLYCLMLSLMESTTTGELVRMEPPGVADLDTRRRIAQWAVNVVDFRDPDAIMTPFVYDPDPFDGSWDADLSVVFNDSAAGRAMREEQLVWGCEYPHLIMTEGFAYHDRRVKDAIVDTTGGDHGRLKVTSGGVGTTRNRLSRSASGGSSRKYGEVDPSLDQSHLPQGSLFIELLCTSSTNNVRLPRELYSDTGQLELSKMSGDNPVWRIAITRARDRDPGKVAATPKSYAQRFDLEHGEPDTARFDRVEESSTNAEAEENVQKELHIERVVWFGGTSAPLLKDEEGHPVYYGRSGDVELGPGKYATVGPRQETKVSDETISLSGDVNIEAKADGGPASMIGGIGVSASEPLPHEYYKEPDGENSAYSTPLDVPLDSGDSAEVIGTVLGDEDENLLISQTHLDYKTALLQRLANPLEEWNRGTNPYITVDWIPIDLTVFNSEDDGNESKIYGPDDDGNPLSFRDVQAGSNDAGSDTDVIETTLDPGVDPKELPFDEDDKWGPFGTNPPDDPTAEEQKLLDEQIARESRERGEAKDPSTPNIWTSRQKKDEDIQELDDKTTDTFFPYSLKHTLGKKNTVEKDGSRPWIAWNDRPFASAMELMMVPWSSPGRLLFEFQIGKSDDGKFYDSASSGCKGYSVSSDGTTWLDRPFAHLPSFYADNAGNYQEIFDFVDVPSRFVGTETWCNPAAGGGTAGFFLPPFNRLSSFREPGRVNINTISDWYQDGGEDYSAIWQCVARLEKDEAKKMWNQILESRDSGKPFRGFHASMDESLLRDDGSTEKEKLIQTYPDTDEETLRTQHAFVEFDGIQRIYNMLTTRSNVYAIWITVGRFECDENGVLTGRELGEENGDIERHRAFFLVDRSIPVGFEPGERHNIDRAVLVKRFIE